MNTLSRTIITLTKQLDTVRNFKVSPKMHNLLHYVDHIKLFGPLALRSTLAIERKHKTSTDWAKVMGCFKNAAFSFLDRHQSMLVVKTADYPKLDFYSADDSEPILLDNKPIGLKKVKLSSPIPHRLKKSILRKFIINNSDHWIGSSAFWTDGENLFCEGLVYISSFVQTHPIGTSLELFSSHNMFIHSKYLSHVNHFIHTVGIDTIVINGLL